MPDPLFRAAPADTIRMVAIDGLTLIYHRASGITHVLAPPAPEILALLVEPMAAADLLAALDSRFALADGDGGALSARLDELVAAGLVASA